MRGLAATSFSGLPLLIGGVVLQLVLDYWDPPGLSDGAGYALIFFSQLLVAGFIASNWRKPGMALVAAGLVLNALPMVLNGGMPVSARAAEIAGVPISEADPGAKHEVVGDDTLLPWLADVIPLPALGSVISIGDVVIGAGIGLFVFGGMGKGVSGRHRARRSSGDVEGSAG